MGMTVMHRPGNWHDFEGILVAKFFVDPNRGVAIVVGQSVSHVTVHSMPVISIGFDEREAKHATELVGQGYSFATAPTATALTAFHDHRRRDEVLELAGRRDVSNVVRRFRDKDDADRTGACLQS
jgi:hypothetical protein